MVGVAQVAAFASGIAVAALSGLLYGLAVCSSAHPFIGVDGVVGVVRSRLQVYTISAASSGTKMVNTLRAR
jgi:hypothetical protein